MNENKTNGIMTERHGSGRSSFFLNLISFCVRFCFPKSFFKGKRTNERKDDNAHDGLSNKVVALVILVSNNIFWILRFYLQ